MIPPDMVEGGLEHGNPISQKMVKALFPSDWGATVHLPWALRTAQIVVDYKQIGSVLK